LRMVVRPRDSELRLDMVAFNCTDSDWPARMPALPMAYRLDVNEYRDLRQLQLVAEYLELP
jgi:single-stranded-DNA-specific exonuclease